MYHDILNLLLFSTTNTLFILYINLFAWPRHPTNLLLKLISYLVYSAHPFCFKVFIIKRVELVPINIIMDKPVLYWWCYCWYHICYSDDVWNRVYLFSYKKPLVSCLSHLPWFNFNYTICGINTPLSPLLQEFDQGPSILRELSITIFTS